MRQFIRFSWLLMFVGLASACSNAVDDVDQFTDCVDICNRYEDCLDQNYDVDACQDRCEAMDHRNGSTDVDRCENCLDERSCVNSTFACATDCGMIVP